MSTWTEIKDPKDIDLQTNPDGTKDINILYSDDDYGNNYYYVSVDMLLQRLRDLKIIQ